MTSRPPFLPSTTCGLPPSRSVYAAANEIPDRPPGPTNENAHGWLPDASADEGNQPATAAPSPSPSSTSSSATLVPRRRTLAPRIPLALATHPVPYQSIVPQSLYRFQDPATPTAAYIPGPDLTWREDATPPELAVSRVTFDLREPVPGMRGVPMSALMHAPREALRKLVRDPDARVLAELERQRLGRVRLSISWPAYPHFPFLKPIWLDGRYGTAPLTRLTLAWTIAVAFYGFSEAVQRGRASPNAWEATFRFGPGGLSFSSLWLVALWQVGADVFEAEIRY